MTEPEPNYPPLSTREIRTLPEGARVIVTWSEGNDGPHEYRVHWSRGELYAQTDEEHYAGRVDLEKWLTYTSGRGARSRESGLSPLRVPNDGGIERPARVRNAPGAWAKNHAFLWVFPLRRRSVDAAHTTSQPTRRVLPTHLGCDGPRRVRVGAVAAGSRRRSG